jgi:hypothetical protein
MVLSERSSSLKKLMIRSATKLLAQRKGGEGWAGGRKEHATGKYNVDSFTTHPPAGMEAMPAEILPLWLFTVRTMPCEMRILAAFLQGLGEWAYRWAFGVADPTLCKE